MSILLIDLSSLFHPAWRANESGPISVAFEATLGGVRRCISKAPEGTHVAVCCDSKGNWRKKLDPSYKAHREKLPEVFYSEFDRVKQRLRDDGLLLWECEGYEADDVIASAVFAAKTGEPVYVASGDKDLLQLIDEHDTVKVVSTRTWDVYGAADVVTKFGVAPVQLGDFLALVGDKSDGIAGCPGVGPVRAAKLLTTYGNLHGVFHAIETGKLVIPGMGDAACETLAAALRENSQQIGLARDLVDLRRDAPIRFEEIYETREVKPIAPKGTEMDDVPEEVIEPESTRVEGPPPIESGATELTRYAPPLAVVEYTKALEPRSFKEALVACRVLFDSRLYQKYKSPEAMAAVVMRGREMGYGAGASLDGFHVISQTGQLAMHAHMIIDRAKMHPDCEWFQCVETDSERATWKTKNKRNPTETSLTYTIGQAVKAGLVKGAGNWQARPDEMIRKTAGVQLARMEYPGAAMGLYCLAELGEDE